MLYRVRSESHIFFADVSEDVDRIVVRFGSKHAPNCVTIIVNANGGHILNNLQFDKYCSHKTKLTKKDGTVEMGTAAMKFVTQLYSTTSFSFTDLSQINCIPQHSVVLSDMSFLAYGKTWYERYFQALPNSKIYYDLQKAYVSKPNVSFENLWNKILKKGATKSLYMKEKQYYANMFAQSNTWAEFWSKWYQEERCKPFVNICDAENHIISWIHPAYKTLHGRDWYIPISAVETYPKIQYEIYKGNPNSFPELEYDLDIEDQRRKSIRRLFGGDLQNINIEAM